MKLSHFSLKILKIELPYDPTIPLLDIYRKELKVGTLTDICMLMPIIAKGGNNPSVYEQMNGCGINIQ